MQWQDRVYGPSSIEDSGILELIDCPTFQRLKGVRQAGPSALAFRFKDVTRFEHSLGVFLLLRRLGADPREQIAGLLHDISHTAFSHAVDFIISSQEQDHHEQLKPLMLDRPDIARASAASVMPLASSTTIRSILSSNGRFRGCAPIASTISCGMASLAGLSSLPSSGGF